MKRLTPAVLLGIASATLVVAFVVWDSGRTSPGDLSAVHAHAAELDAGNNCAACHGDERTTMAAACGTCHALVAQQIASSTGFHGTLDSDASRCGACHDEHHGTDARLVGPQSFALGGVPDRDAFAHEKLAFALTGVHVGLDCKRCHEHADDKELARGAQRFTGKEQACAACHADPHAGRLPDCAACHGQERPFAEVARFVHPDTFPLSGVHARVGCVECHPKGGPFSIEASGVAGGSARATRDARTCEQCHAAPHDASLLVRVVAHLGAQAGAECVTCHPLDSASFRGPSARMPKDLHALTGFPLEPPHAEQACEQCHSPGAMLEPAPSGSSAALAFRALHPGRSAQECKACHVDPHAGQFEEGAFAGQSCRACHAALAFTPPDFDIDDHARTAFALSGAHEAVACAACHTQPHAGMPRKFTGTTNACAGCHADAHAGAFASKEDARGCERCHTTTSFSAVAGEFDHARWTGFELRGEHARLACAACHPSAPTPDARGRTFGRVENAFTGPPRACSTCHADVHAGAFGRMPAAVAQTEGCARCHTEEGFDRARDGFDHARSTSFALTGAHARASCESCHVPRATPDAHGRRLGLVSELFPGPTSDCRTCHVDRHSGAFDQPGMPAEVNGSSGCSRCHTTDSFGSASNRFDHAAWTGFALEGAHALAACESCHDSTPGEHAGFAPPRGKACQDCHSDPHVGQFARAGSTDCARCHTSASSFHAITFDHARDSRFALDPTHAKLSCSSCHVPAAVDGSVTAVRYKPLGTVCGDCHDPRGGK